MSGYKLHDGTLYDYTAGVYCGVLIKERVMKELAKLQAKYVQDVKRLLSNAADKNEVFPSMWNLHHPDGVQTAIYYIDLSCDVHERIKNASITIKPTARKTVFIASSMEEAEAMADAHYAETGGSHATHN